MALRKMYFVPGKWGAPPLLRANPDPPPDRPPPPQPGRVARRAPKRRCVARRVLKRGRVTRRAPKPRRVARRVPKRCRVAKRVAKYIHPADKWLALRTKLRKARLGDERLIRAKMADFMHKALPAYTAAVHPSKYRVVEQEPDTPVGSCRGNAETRKSR
jgi:hypothetical protein